MWGGGGRRDIGQPGYLLLSQAWVNNEGPGHPGASAGLHGGLLQGPPSQQLLTPPAGHFLGPLIFPQELAKPVFSSRLTLPWFIYFICFLFSLT